MRMADNSEEKEFDFMKIEWQRGITPKDIKDKCFRLCRDYLGGIWLKLTIDQFVIRRLSGGLTNQLYYCAIDEKHRSSDTEEPQEVAIRLYEAKHFNNYDNKENERLSDLIIALLISENKLGPKIYGLFDSGQIQRYYKVFIFDLDFPKIILKNTLYPKHKSFRSEEQKEPLLVEALATKLAQIHAMDVPIKKTGNWIFDTFDNFYKEAEKLFDLNALIDECNCESLKRYDLKQELEWLKHTILECDSPLSFTHVDFRGSNIMVTESDGLVLCDFEYSCYGFRGADFGTIFAEWGRVWGEFTKPQEFPDDQTLKPFIESYIKESVKLNGKTFTSDKRNSIEHILKEGKVFALVSNMFFVLITLKSNDSIVPELEFDKKKAMVFTDMCYHNYYYLKQRFIKDKVF